MTKPKHKYKVRTLSSGTKEWRRDGKLHRGRDLPASELADGSKMWCRAGRLHRSGGRPAVVWANGDVEFWVDGKQVFPPPASSK